MCCNFLQPFKEAILAQEDSSLQSADLSALSTAADSYGQPAGFLADGDASLTSASSTRLRRLTQVVTELSRGYREWRRLVNELLTTRVHDHMFADEGMMNNVAAEGRPLAVLNVVSIYQHCRLDVVWTQT
jgi:hypothetical protein